MIEKILSSLVVIAMFTACTPRVKPFTAGRERYRFDVRLAPAGAGAYRGSARVTDLQAQRTIEVEPFTLRTGQVAISGGHDEKTGAALAVTVTPAAGGKTAVWRTELRRDGALLASATGEAPME